MYKQEHKKLKELQFLQATNFLLLCKLIPNLKQEKNFIFNLPMSDGENKKNSEVDFRFRNINELSN